MKKIIKVIWQILGILYIPIYVLSWALHKVARLMLAISYFGLLNKQAGKDIISNLFKQYGKH